MTVLGTQLSEILSDVTKHHHSCEQEYRNSLDIEYRRILKENGSSMSSDDISILSATKAVLFWSYQDIQK